MPLLGAHGFIAGGYYKAAEIAHECGCDCVQLFTKNNNQWQGKDINDDDAARFQAALAERGLTHPLSHDSYLINLASPDETLWRKSVEAFVVELQRAARLGIPYVVTHPGAYTTSSEAAGLKRVVRALNEAHRRTARLAVGTLLENTAGQGTNLGWRFEHLAAILDGVRAPERVAVCIDTCHLFAAGYPLATTGEYRATLRALDRSIDIRRVKAFHLNDSRKELGSRVDRHEHIGQGKLGLPPFRRLLNDPRFRDTPMYLETPKEHEGRPDGVRLDRMNLATLRSLIET